MTTKGRIIGFEPTASRATIWRSNQLSYILHRNVRGTIYQLKIVPEGIRTPDPRLRRPLLYPAELQVQAFGGTLCSLRNKIGVTGFEPATS